MAVVTVKNKFQVVIPRSVREKIGVGVGDLLEARVERGTIIFTPKTLVDRGIAESLEDFKRGRTRGPFETSEELLASIRRRTRKARSKKRSKSGSNKSDTRRR
jgi:AbrB family looped-hinge helix DNA binding protein